MEYIITGLAIIMAAHICITVTLIKCVNSQADKIERLQNRAITQWVDDIYLNRKVRDMLPKGVKPVIDPGVIKSIREEICG